MPFFLLLLLGVLLASPTLFASNLSIHGFVQGNFSSRVTGKDLPASEGGDFISGEERLQLNFDAKNDSGNASLKAKTDLFHDAVTNNADIDLREAYAEFSSRYIDFRVGRQIITWGVGDLLFINDTFPKDWAAFFSGRPLEYLKIGSDSLKLGIYPGIFSAELIVTPIFSGDNMPSGRRFFLYDPLPSVTTRETVDPEKNLKNVGVAVRIYHDIAGIDASFYFSKGFWRTPSMRLDDTANPAQISYIYPGLYTYGLSLQRSGLGGVLGAEAGYYDSIDDRSGGSYSIPNSEVRYLTSYKRQLWADATFGLQYYGEYMLRNGAYKANLPPGFVAQDRLRHLTALRLTQLLAHQTLKLSLFAFFSPSDLDYQIIPEVQYHLTDELWTALGANVFGGRDNHTFFGQLDKNDNIYLTVRYEF